MRPSGSKETGSRPSTTGINYSRRSLALLLLLSLVLWTTVRCCSENIWTFNSSTTSYSYLAEHCSHIEPIGASEFHDRQTTLATVLHSLNGAAYIAEPGSNAQYFANLSLSKWKLSERPFLLMVVPSEVTVTQSQSLMLEIRPKLLILAPKFELSRAQLLDIPCTFPIEFVPWPEEENPYIAALNALDQQGLTNRTIFIDEGSRYFIVDGIRQAAKDMKVNIAAKEIRALRERKSPAELDIMRCANEATLLALRAVQKKMYIGMQESEARDMIHDALLDVGLKTPQALVLFGENAALPHGSGNDKVLLESDFALFDIMGTLHEYWSDLTRTIALPKSKISAEQLEIWYLVNTAQTTALYSVKADINASDVDAAARSVIEVAGRGQYFTHRLGHGIGLQLHESPYLRGGYNVPLSPGNVCSDEPGIYIEGYVGVRLEDCFYVDDIGKAILLTAGVGGQAFSPWEP